MANTLTAGNPEYRSKRMQINLSNMLVARMTANYEERAKLSNGDKVHRPYFSDAKVRDYTKGTAISAQDRSITDEYLDVDKTKVIMTYIDDVDKIQNNYNLVNTIVDRDSYVIRNELDGRYLREITNAALDVDDGDIGGTSGNAISLTTSNCFKTFSKTRAVMREGNVEDNKVWNAIVTPSVVSVMEQSMVANGFQKADMALTNGYKGNFAGFRIFESNNVCHANVGTFTGNVSADDTFTVAGVTFTFKAAPSAAGEVDLGSDQDVTLANLVAAINGGTGAGTLYIALSQADRDTLNASSIYAVADTTANTISVYSAGSITVSESLDNFTLADQRALCYVAQQGATDLVIQKDVTVQVNKCEDKLGYNYITRDLYGLNTFTEGKNRMCELNIAV